MPIDYQVHESDQRGAPKDRTLDLLTEHYRQSHAKAEHERTERERRQMEAAKGGRP